MSINNKIKLFVKGNSEPYYQVIFKNINGLISIKCDCRAGELTKLCKHKLTLIRGDVSALYNGELYDEDQSEMFNLMKTWIASSGLALLISKHDQTQKEFLLKENEFKKIKAVIEDAMRKGA